MSVAEAPRIYSTSDFKKIESVSVRLLVCTEYLFILVTELIVKM